MKNNQAELKNKITKMKTTLEGINSRINEAEKQISKLKGRMGESLPWNRRKLFTKHSFQIWRHIQVESEEMEKDILSK